MYSAAGAIEVAADLGSFVLDAQVETLAAVAGKDATEDTPAIWVRLLTTRRKEGLLLNTIDSLRDGLIHTSGFLSGCRRDDLWECRRQPMDTGCRTL